MTRAFLDGSRAGKGDKDFLSVAGFVSPAKNWSVIQREWRKARAKAGLPYFHMTDFMSKYGKPYRDWPETKRQVKKEALISRLLHLLNTHATFGVGVALKVSDFQTLPDEDKALCDYNPYALCAAQCIGLVTKTLEEGGIREPISYVIESGGTGEAAFIAVMTKLCAASERIRETLRILSVMPGTKQRFPALDSADFLAWQMAQLAQRKVGAGLVPLPAYMARLTIPTPHHYLDRNGLTLWAAGLTRKQRADFTALFSGDVRTLKRNHPRETFARAP